MATTYLNQKRWLDYIEPTNYDFSSNKIENNGVIDLSKIYRR